MIEIKDIKLPVLSGQKELERYITQKLKVKEVPKYKILRRSIDARKKDNILYVYTVGVYLKNEKNILKKLRDKNILASNEISFQYPKCGLKAMQTRPIVVGAGPAGLFCAFLLAKQGYRPVVIERGLPVEQRVEMVNHFWEKGQLEPECNVQFGEGGAGTFSDGKLNTQVKDKYGRIRFVLEKFVEYGASEEILYDNKPHVGTDKLVGIVKGIRTEIEALGGTFLFDTKVVDFKIEKNVLKSVKVVNKDEERWIDSEHVVLAIGHSARDTFSVLYDKKITMKAKDFAMGVRVQHPTGWIQSAMYGDGEAAKHLPAAPYKLTYQASNGRGVYSFCMCPGGYVVNASSEHGHTAVNGMSYSGRNSENSNAAIVVMVRKEDFESDHPLAGVAFQRKLEKAIYEEGNGKVLSQRFEDFCKGIPSKEFGQIFPQIKGQYVFGDVRKCLPDFMAESIEEGMRYFATKISRFDDDDVILSGVESRTSSPVRIERDEEFISNIKGIYPCGEGAGYAGGIMSAAMDGMKVAEAIIKNNSQPYEKDII